MFKPNRTAAHASIVDQSFEELDKLARQAAQAGEDDIEDLDDSSDDTDLDEDDIDSEDGDDTDLGDDEEEGSDDEDDLESEDDDSASDEDEDGEGSDDDEYSDESEAEDEDEEEVIVDEDGDESDEDDDGEFDTVAEDEGDEDEVVIDEDEDESGDDEDEDEDEDSDISNEDEVLAALKAEGLCVVIGSAESISRHEFGLAVASLEDDEFNEADEADASEDEDADSECDSSEDEDEDKYADDSDDEVIDDGSEDEDDTDSEDDADSDIEDEEDGSDDEEFAEGGDDEDEEIEVDADEEELDEDRLAAVASEEFLAAASASDVDFSFYADSTNPVWNVIVAGVPAARIALSSYGEGASEVASFFRTPAFAEGIRRAMASEGVLPLLQRSNAEFYANSYKSSELFAEAAASAESVATRKVTAALSGLREDFVDAMKIVSAGMDKNFFPTRTNHLKRALFIALSNAGVHNPQSVIETAFAANAAHFETLAEMATELLDKPAEHRDALREAVEEAGVIDRSVKNEESPAAAASANPGLVLARAMANTATASDAFKLEGSVASQKNALKSLGAGLLG